jgi:hypothetical protein
VLLYYHNKKTKTSSNWLARLFQKLLGTQSRANKVQKILEPNESTMEKNNEEPVEQPDDKVKVKVKNVIRVTEPQGNKKSVVHISRKDTLVFPNDAPNVEKDKAKLIQKANEKSDSLNKAYYNRY